MKKFYTLSLWKRLCLFGAIGSISVISHAQSYIQSSCDYAPLSTDGTVLCLSDDEVSSAIPLGFTFNLYENPFTDAYISSNGYLSFVAGLDNSCCIGRTLPDMAYPFSIFFAQEDMDPNFCADGVITYYTTGAPGSQIFVLSFTNVPNYNIDADPTYFPVTVQVQLYEGTDEVRIVTTNYDNEFDGNGSTMGLNQSGTNADPVPGRNGVEYSAFDECISFMPDGLPDNGCTDPSAINYDPGADIDDGSCFFGYNYTACTYDVMETSGSIVCLSDDSYSSAIPIGFSFPFYGTNHNDVYIGSNGIVSFTSGLESGCCSGVFLPSGAFPNTIFIGQEDFNPNSCTYGEINYYTTGAPGSQVFVVNFIDVVHYSFPFVDDYFPVTIQLQLHEATGEVKILLTDWPSDGNFSTVGLNYNDVYSNPAPGKNSEIWSATEECHSWVPLGEVADVCLPPAGLSVDGITADDAVLHWNAIAGADMYRVSIINTATGDVKKHNFPTNFVEVTNKLEPLTTYAFRVRTICDIGLEDVSGLSEAYYFTTLGRIGETISGVSLYPNPNNGTFTIQLSGLENESFELTVYDAIGNAVYSKTLSSDNGTYTESIDLDVPAGIYYVNIKNEMNQMNYPMVIQQ